MAKGAGQPLPPPSPFALRTSPSLPMPDDTTTQHRISAEGADPLLFAGVNDANLLELQRTLGVRVSFRGDAVTLTGTPEQLERAMPVVQGLLDLARMGEPVSPDDVYR